MSKLPTPHTQSQGMLAVPRVLNVHQGHFLGDWQAPYQAPNSSRNGLSHGETEPQCPDGNGDELPGQHRFSLSGLLYLPQCACYPCCFLSTLPASRAYPARMRSRYAWSRCNRVSAPHRIPTVNATHWVTGARRYASASAAPVPSWLRLLMPPWPLLHSLRSG